MALYNKYIKRQKASLCIYAETRENDPVAADLDIVLTTDEEDPGSSILLEEIRDVVVDYLKDLPQHPPRKHKKNRKKRE